MFQHIQALRKDIEEGEFNMRNMRKQIGGLEESKQSTYVEIKRLTEATEASKEDFISKLRESSTDLLKLIEENKQFISKLELNQNMTQSKALTNANHIRELQNLSTTFASQIKQ